MKYKITFKSQQVNPTTSWKFAVIPREAYYYCSQCKTFPFCVILHNSGNRYKTCPCHKCIVQMMCYQQCDNFKQQTTELFKMKITTDYKAYWYNILEKPPSTSSSS